MSGRPASQLENRVKTLERAFSAQAELIASLRRRIDMLERKPPPDQRPDLAGALARISK